VTGSRKHSATDAVRAVASLLGEDFQLQLAFIEEKGNVQAASRTFVNGVTFAQGTVPAELNYVQIENGERVILAWSLEFDMKDN